MLVWPCILIERDISWRLSPRKSSIKCHSNLVSPPLRKPPDLVKDLYGGKTNDTKTRVDIWTSMDVVPVEYGKIAQTFHWKNLVLSVYYWSYLQVGLFDVAYYFSVDVDLYLD